MTTIQIREFSTLPELALEGWGPNGCTGGDYDTDRARALYAALGVSPGDEESYLARHTDGRWALFGLTVEGHKFAVEAPAPRLRPQISGTFTRKDLDTIGGPIAWQGTVAAERREAEEASLNALRREALEALDANPDATAVEIEAGEVRSTIV